MLLFLSGLAFRQQKQCRGPSWLHNRVKRGVENVFPVRILMCFVVLSGVECSDRDRGRAGIDRKFTFYSSDEK